MGPHVSHHAFHVHSALSPSALLFLLMAATWYAALPYMVSTCHCPFTEGQWLRKTGRLSSLVFLPLPFKSTLQHFSQAPNAPGPFSMAELWNPRSQAGSKTISPSDWANIHFTFPGQNTSLIRVVAHVQILSFVISCSKIFQSLYLTCSGPCHTHLSITN